MALKLKEICYFHVEPKTIFQRKTLYLEMLHLVARQGFISCASFSLKPTDLLKTVFFGYLLSSCILFKFNAYTHVFTVCVTESQYKKYVISMIYFVERLKSWIGMLVKKI